MSDIVDEILELHQWFPAKEGIFDQHNGYALAELMEAKRAKQFKMENFSDTLISDVYRLTKRLYAEGLLELFDHPVLVPEILTLEAEKRAGASGSGDDPKGKIIVRKPNRRGAHDDISDAFVRAVWLCYSGFRARPVNLATGAGGMAAQLGTMAGNEKRDTQAAFFLKKLKAHGEHPRGLYSVRGKRMTQLAGRMG